MAWIDRDQARHISQFGAKAIECVDKLDEVLVRIKPRQDQQLERFLIEYDALRSLAMSEHSEPFIAKLIKRVDVIHNEVLSPELASRRARNVIAMRKFAQVKQPILEQPGDLSAFWAHYDQLDPAEQQFEVFGHERLDGSGDGCSA